MEDIVKFEHSIKATRDADRGEAGSFRLDIFYQYKNETYDAKTGKAIVTLQEANKKLANLPDEPPPSIYEVKPMGGYPKPIILSGKEVFTSSTPKPKF